MQGPWNVQRIGTKRPILTRGVTYRKIEWNVPTFIRTNLSIRGVAGGGPEPPISSNVEDIPKEREAI